MHSPHTFFGKVTTLLVGVGLSWLTVMHPRIEQAASKLIGNTQLKATTQSAAAKSRVPKSEAIQAPAMQTTLGPERMETNRSHRTDHEPDGDMPNQVASLSARLRDLGASYLLLERLTDPGGACYRVRCDLAGEHAPVKCCFEAVGETAVDALQEVLRAVRQLDASSSSMVESVGSFP